MIQKEMKNAILTQRAYEKENKIYFFCVHINKE